MEQVAETGRAQAAEQEVLLQEQLGRIGFLEARSEMVVPKKRQLLAERIGRRDESGNEPRAQFLPSVRLYLFVGFLRRGIGG